MTEPSQPTVDGSVCAQCGARMAAGAPWCTLCYAVPGATTETNPHPEDGDVPQRVVGVSPAERRHLRADAAANAETSASADAGSKDVDAIAAQMLAQLAAQRPAPSRLGALAPSLSSPVARAAAGAAGVVLFSLLVFGLMALLGTLL